MLPKAWPECLSLYREYCDSTVTLSALLNKYGMLLNFQCSDFQSCQLLLQNSKAKNAPKQQDQDFGTLLASLAYFQKLNVYDSQIFPTTVKPPPNKSLVFTFCIKA